MLVACKARSCSSTMPVFTVSVCSTTYYPILNDISPEILKLAPNNITNLPSYFVGGQGVGAGMG